MNEATVSRGQVGLSTYGGLFFTTLSTLMYEVLLTRIFSVTMWYHFAFVAVSVALFGMTVGALIVYLLPERFPDERTKERLARASLLFSLSIVLSFVTQLSIPFNPQWTVIGVYSVVFTYLVISVPFIFSGIVVCLTLTRFPGRVSRLYAVDLIGAALGAVTLIWLLDLLRDGPSTVLAIAALSAVGASFFAYDGGRPRNLVLAAIAALLFIGLAVGNTISVQNHHPVLRVRWVKGEEEPTPLYERWNTYSRVAIFGDPNASESPFGWGWSTKRPRDVRVRQLFMNLDATALTPLTGFDGDPGKLGYLKYDVVNVAHHLRDRADILVIGSGGGRDVLAALAFGQRSVTAIEMNRDVLEAVNGQFGDFTGHLDRRPGVTFVADEARSYLARSDQRFHIIQISLIDTWAATAAGAFALSENGLYTVEAWELFLDRLTPDGVLSVSRWYVLERPVEIYRLTSLATEVLRSRGVAEPRRHIALIHSRPPWTPVTVGTILVSARPFSEEDIGTLRRVAAELEFEVALDPYDSLDANLERIVAGDLDDVDLDVPVNLSAPTDDTPFFFQTVRLWDLFRGNAYGDPLLTRSVLVLFSLSIAVVVLTAVFILGPLLLTMKRFALRGTAPFMVFFAAIGLAFMLVEISQMQRLIIFLGHPTYALSVVLFSLLLSSGVGSFLSERLVNPNPRLRLTHLWPLLVLLLVLIAFGLVTPAAIDGAEAATTPVRVLTATALLAPMGLVMGIPFPVGMKVASLRPNAPTTFLWGINGATSVCASVLAVAIALSWGISTAFWVGCFCYATAAAALGLVAVRGRV